MITVGCIYSMFPRLYGKKEMYSIRLIDWHFWTTTIGVVLYIASMWIAGVMQGLMWRATNDDGSLTYLHRSAQRHLPVLRGAPAGRRAGARGHVRHGIQLLEDRCRT